MQIAVADGVAAPKISSIEMTGTQQRFEIEAAKEPVSVEFDPHVWALVDAKLTKK